MPGIMKIMFKTFPKFRFLSTFSDLRYENFRIFVPGPEPGVPDFERVPNEAVAIGRREAGARQF